MMSPLKNNSWRLIVSQPENGAWNMALDEAILTFTASKQMPPTLRLYAWDPPCISLGYAQTSKDVDLQALETQKWDIVRRPTGGRAILHQNEVTYSICTATDEPFMKGNILESYCRVSKALLVALEKLNVHADAQKVYTDLPTTAQAACFEVPSNYEITVGGKKLIGSAQSRKMGGILQHGALPLSGDLSQIHQVLRFSSIDEREKANARLSDHATTLESASGSQISYTKVCDALISAFSENLNTDLIPEQPSNEEIEHTKKLIKEKYSNATWTFRF
jgi:lipoyl(octanoyl) transferase